MCMVCMLCMVYGLLLLNMADIYIWNFFYVEDCGVSRIWSIAAEHGRYLYLSIYLSIYIYIYIYIYIDIWIVFYVEDCGVSSCNC